MTGPTDPTPRKHLQRSGDRSNRNDAWDELVELYDREVLEQGAAADRPETGQYDGELFYAHDRRILFRWNQTATRWEAVAGVGSEGNAVPVTAYYDAVDVSADVIVRAGDDPISKVEGAPRAATIWFDPREQFLLEESIRHWPEGADVFHPNLKHPDSPKGEQDWHLVQINSDNVRLHAPHLDHNVDNMSFDDKAAALRISDCTGVRVYDPVVKHASRHNILVTGATGRAEDILVRGARLFDSVADGVSIEGRGERTWNVTVRDVCVYGSRERGGIEVADGARHTLVEDVWAEDVDYVCAHEDHGRSHEWNLDTTFRTVRGGDDVGSLVASETHPDVDHRNLTIEDVHGESFAEPDVRESAPVSAEFVEDVTIRNVSISKFDLADRHPVAIRHCTDVTIDAVTVSDCETSRAGLLLEDVVRAGLSDANLETLPNAPGVVVRLDDPAKHIETDCRSIDVHEVRTEQVAGDGIRIEDDHEGTYELRDYIITENHASVAHSGLSKPDAAIVDRNLPGAQ